MSSCSVAEPLVSTAGAEGAAKDAATEDSFEQKRKQHYKMDLRAMKAAAEALDDDDDDDEDDDKEAFVKEPEANDFGRGHWAIGPEVLHGGPKRGSGFAQSTGGSANASLPVAAAVGSGANAACALAGPLTAPPLVPAADGQEVASSSTGSKLPPCTKKVITWDEETIAEHDLERGTRQKIEEPNTPWMGSPSASAQGSAIHSSTPAAQPEDSDVQPVDATAVPLVEQEVQERLRSWFHQERHRVSIQEQWGNAERPGTAESQSDELSLEEKKARDFAEKRKQHYKVDLKAMRAAVEDDEDEEDESEEDP